MKEKTINNLLGPWNDLNLRKKFKGPLNHKFLDRNRTLKLNWKRLHDKVPEFLKSSKRLKILDVACGNGATMEIFRYYGHECWGIDYGYSEGFKDGNWLYKPMIKSQNLRCKVHNGSEIPYPFENKEFDLLICYGAITFFKPISKWPEIMNEFARLTKKGILVGVNKGKDFNKGEKYLDQWSHSNFKLARKQGSIYKWVKK